MFFSDNLNLHTFSLYQFSREGKNDVRVHKNADKSVINSLMFMSALLTFVSGETSYEQRARLIPTPSVPSPPERPAQVTRVCVSPPPHAMQVVPRPQQRLPKRRLSFRPWQTKEGNTGLSMKSEL